MKLFQIRIENYNGKVQQELYKIVKPNEEAMKMLVSINEGFNVVLSEIEISGIVSLASLENGVAEIVGKAQRELEKDCELFHSVKNGDSSLGRKCAMSRYKVDGLHQVELLIKRLKREAKNG